MTTVQVNLYNGYYDVVETFTATVDISDKSAIDDLIVELCDVYKDLNHDIRNTIDAAEDTIDDSFEYIIEEIAHGSLL